MRIDLRCIVEVRASARVWRAALALRSVGVFACSANNIVSVQADGHNRTIAATVGQEVDVTLGNVGPAEYVSPPDISSGALAYLGVDVVPPFNPGGPTQRFHFRAVGAGQAVVDFRRMLGDSLISVVEDTVQVR
jgi:hypothetical protein